MPSPLIFGVSLAAGFILGSRASRDGYEQVAAVTRDLTDDLGLAATAGALSGRASEMWADARRRLA